jgi:2-oxoglutarate dehydrogenase E2 component (dihydrolipoamide succinyltransferase)
MSTDVIMPQMGESIAEGTVTKWLKNVGDRVEADQLLFEISTDKLDAEIPSPVAGILAKILVKEGETVAVNTVVAVIEPAITQAAEAFDKESLESVPEHGSGSVAAALEFVSSASSIRQANVSFASSEASAAGPEDKVLSSPLVRRLASEHHIDLCHVRGTGTGGRIRKEDLLAHLRQKTETDTAAGLDGQARGTGSDVPPLSASAIVFSGPTAVVPMTPMRKRIAEHMLASRRTSAHVTTVFEVEMTKVASVREKYVEECARSHGVKLTYTTFFVRAVTAVIKSFPIFNSSLEGTNIVYKRDVNIGIAVALETGLIVPVIKRADERSLLEIARAVQDLAARARSKRLRVEDVQDGTFTITNPGVFGSLFGSPIINQPQVAILAIGVIQQRVVVRGGDIAIRPMVYLSLSYDHRVIDGELGARFLWQLKTVLEEWSEPVL